MNNTETLTAYERLNLEAFAGSLPDTPEGKLTATKGGDAFWAWARPLLDECGPYPHATMTYTKGAKVAKTYLLKASCPSCDYTIRLTKKWADRGLPDCPVCSDHAAGAPVHMIGHETEDAE